MLRLLLVRHGETDWNCRGLIQGQLDVPLNARGRDQARRLAERLADEPVIAAYASDLSRAWETARILVASRGIPLTPEPRLREVAFGRWEKQTFDHVRREEPALWHSWCEGPPTVAPEGGEPLEAVSKRLLDWLADLQSRHSQGTVLAVSHGAVLRVLLCLLLDAPPYRYLRFRLDSVALSVVLLDGQARRIALVNDTRHLASSVGGVEVSARNSAHQERGASQPG